MTVKLATLEIAAIAAMRHRSNGPNSRFRAWLPCSSGTCFHQISLVGLLIIMVGVTRFERARAITPPGSKPGPLPDYGPTLRLKCLAVGKRLERLVACAGLRFP